MRFLFKNDLCHIFSKRRIMIYIYLLLPLINYILIKDSQLSKIEIFSSCLGLNFNINENNVFEIIIYIMNISFFTFLIVDLFLKDICYQIDNIFLRISPKKWVLTKIICSFIILFTIRFIQYMILILFLHTDLKNLHEIFILFITEILYLILIQYIILSTIIFLKKGKYKFLVYVIAILFIYLIPKNINNIVESNLSFLLFIMTVIIYIFFICYFVNKHKYIFAINREE